MDSVKRTVEQNPDKSFPVGLRDATEAEIKDIKEWLTARSIRFQHKTTRNNGLIKLPHNGVLYVNPQRSKMKC